ncbi:MAG: MerR family transcriptional regulator [Acidimicrobiales bacterium]
MAGEGYSIEELARRTGTTTRTVRLYRERGLVPPPDRMGRGASYGEGHLTRLRMIVDLTGRGYSLAAIGDLLALWERGGDITEVLGIEAAIGRAWVEQPGFITMEDLARLLPGGPPDLQRAVELEILRPASDGFVIPNPRFFRTGVELVAMGVSVSAVLDLAATLRSKLSSLADDFVTFAIEQVEAPMVAEGVPTDLTATRDIVERLRGLTADAVAAVFAEGMEKATAARAGEVLAALRDAVAEPRQWGRFPPPIASATFHDGETWGPATVR